MRFRNLFGIFMMFAALPIVAPAQDHWSWAYPRPQGNTLYGATYGDGRFVACGAYNTIITSTDGTSWQVVKTGADTFYVGIAYGNNQFVAVGGSGQISVSSDVSTWTDAASPTGQTLRSIVHASDLFVAVGDGGTILTSTDASSWIPRLAGVTSDLFAVAYGAQTFVAVGRGGVLLFSTDGVAWDIASAPLPTDLQGVAYGNGRFVAVGGNAVWTSSNGRDWAAQAIGSNGFFMGISFADGHFLMFGGIGGVQTVLLRSTDGVDWEPTSGTSTSQQLPIHAIAFGAGVHVALGLFGYLSVSADGSSWTDIQAISQTELNALAEGGGTFVVVGDNGTILTSREGETWSPAVSGTPTRLLGIAYGNGRFVTGGYFGGFPSVITSTDGATWTAVDFPGRMYNVAFGGGRFVAVGEGFATTSVDGVNWSPPVPDSTRYGLSELRYIDGQFIGLGGGEIATSPDGVEWTLRLHDGGSTFAGVAYGNGLYVAVSGDVFTSPDAITWTRQPTQDLNFYYGIAFVDGEFVASRETFLPADILWSAVVTSIDGINWQREPAFVTGLAPIEYAAGRLWALGSGAVLVSRPNPIFASGFEHL